MAINWLVGNYQRAFLSKKVGIIAAWNQIAMVIPTRDIVAVGFEPTFSGYEPDALQAPMAISSLCIQRTYTEQAHRNSAPFTHKNCLFLSYAAT